MQDGKFPKLHHLINENSSKPEHEVKIVFVQPTTDWYQ